MNSIELADALTGRKWERFVAKLNNSMEDYPITGVTVVIREMTAEEITNETDRYVLTFNHDLQKFEVAVDPSRSFPAAWQIADTIDHFLNPDEDNAKSTLESDQ